MTPLKRAARALMLHHDIDPDVFIGMHGGYGDWIDAARAVLGAIREPSEGMIDVAGDYADNNQPFAYEDFWRAMIDAALEEA